MRFLNIDFAYIKKKRFEIFRRIKNEILLEYPAKRIFLYIMKISSTSKPEFA